MKISRPFNHDTLPILSNKPAIVKSLKNSSEVMPLISLYTLDSKNNQQTLNVSTIDTNRSTHYFNQVRGTIARPLISHFILQERIF